MKPMKFDTEKGYDQFLSPKTRKALAEWRERQRQKNLANRRITGYESAPDKDGLEEVRGG